MLIGIFGVLLLKWILNYCFIRCPSIFICILWPWNWSNLDGICWLPWRRDSLGQLQPFHPLLLTLWGCQCPLSRYYHYPRLLLPICFQYLLTVVCREVGTVTCLTTTQGRCLFLCKAINKLTRWVYLASIVALQLQNYLVDIDTHLIEASLSEPHTSVTALLNACVCMYVCIRVAIYRKFKLNEQKPRYTYISNLHTC